ncbi:MAG: DUF1819 family protein [Anaerolineaceae bacterium]
MKINKYRTSFTTGGLYYQESRKLAQLYFATSEWDHVRKQILEENLLQTRTHSSLMRTTNEVIQRLQTLNSNQMNVLIEGNRKDQTDILWLAVCKHYEIIREFAIKVIREKYLRLDRQLTFLDWDSFFNSKAEWDDHLENLTDSTKDKLRQVLFRMLHEAEIISTLNAILPAILSPRVTNVIKQENAENLLIYPMSNGIL